MYGEPYSGGCALPVLPSGSGVSAAQSHLAEFPAVQFRLLSWTVGNRPRVVPAAFVRVCAFRSFVPPHTHPCDEGVPSLRADTDPVRDHRIGCGRRSSDRIHLSTRGIPQDSSMSSLTVFGLSLGLMVSATFVYLALAGLIHVPEFPVPGLGE